MKLKEALVSIIVPVYNDEKYIDTCIDSLIKQTYQTIEIIIVNDGSTDTSIQKCEKYKLMDSRIQIYNQENQGVSSARNYGIKRTKGKYISFVDADDYVEENFIESLVRIFPPYGISICGYKRIGDGKKNAEYIVNEEMDTELLYRYIFAKSDITCGCWNKLFSVDIIKKNQIYFDEKLSIGEDMIFLAEYLNCVYDKFAYVPASNYIYRKNTQSAMQSAYTNQNFNEKKVTCLETVDKLIILGENSGDLYVKSCFSYRAVRTCLWLLVQMIYCKKYKVDILIKIKKRIQNNIFRYLKYGEGSKLEHVAALVVCISPSVIYLMGDILLRIRPTFFAKYLN